MRAALAAFLLLALVAPAVPANGPTALWPDGPGHSHSDMAQHAGYGSGLDQVAQVKVRDGTVGEVDAVGDLAVVAHWTGGAGLSTIDIGDPANPRRLGGISLPGTGTDAKLLPDGQRAIVSTQGGGCRPFSAGPMATGCGLNLVDVSNPAAPRLLWGAGTSNRGVHMFDVASIGPVPFVFAVDQGDVVHVQVLAVVGPTLVPVGAFTTDDPSTYIHDVTVRPDPVVPGRMLAYVAAWDQGVWIYDVTVPSAAVLLGSWDPPEANNIHTVMPAFVEGRLLVVAAPEYLNTVHILDATDPTSIVKVGAWRFPDLKPEGGSTWSTHDFNVRDGKVYLAHYHGGVVVLGLRTMAEAASPPLLAWRLPAGVKYGGSTAPNTWDALPIGDGYVLAGDISLGVVVLREA